MIYRKLSKRQKLAMLWWQQPRFRNRDAVICDGSIRSGKTVCMTVGFFLWSMSRFSGEKFAICGKTIESLRRNVILNLRDWLPEDLQITERRAENKIIVSDGCGRENTYFLFGGRDESSYMLVQGITLAGALLDEVALMPRSFVEQVCARCSVFGSKLWFNCNPDGPEHWFYKTWILRAGELNALHIHFTMADNPSLAPEIRERYERMYVGVFYRRYIQGLWCIAEGLIYNFDRDVHTFRETPQKALEGFGEWYISCDYGTLNPFSAGLWWVYEGKAYRVSEYYWSGRSQSLMKTDEEYYAELEKLAGDRYIQAVIVDPSAASFIATVRRHGRFSVRKAKNDVLSGIRLTASMLTAGVIRISENCTDAIREFGLYRWDEKGEVDRVVKENDHAMDDIRYFCNTVMRRDAFARRMLGGICDEETD
jgi:PBSX family phage terminase large subunit